MCWLSEKCVIGGPYFKKVGDTYLQEDHPAPADRADEH
jgi:hypothetical protein